MPNKCKDCEEMIVISDPDPYDWFCDDDCAMVCKLVKADSTTLENARHNKSRHAADYSVHKVISCALRPYELHRVKKPDWCPLDNS